ncbi:uncharacterized protein BDR25DRAFT_266704 [Lindgomyces ingoldianus]|uniref:Uncharacterized protein n=1 Tax=Lindgomyces ingoldianus TaxID=673940 RepID=A0ACB6QNN0_9PLEO|nr:uncharacterized protein BDR25DRAFT_266704 [Lindgomyces ingoldianus]KAF2467707.1 hypothetical protein BDR25DRAFT_266704 [Lindgomyces ingoldianus]
MGKTYCSRCEREFPSQQALQQHYNDSASHYRCEICGFDGSTWDKWIGHHRKTKHRVVCQGCDDGKGWAWVAGSQEYLAHLKEQNVCQACEMHFQNASNLDHHKMVHLERSIECYACYQKFPTYPAMILHLESGTCPSKINILHLNESAAMCFQWKAYLDPGYRDELLNRDDLKTEYSEPVYPFKCPECVVSFTKLSGLFQHVYSKACNQGLYEGKMAKLIKWLENRHSAGENE